MTLSTPPNEKYELSHVDNVAEVKGNDYEAANEANVDIDHGFDPREVKRVIRKVDYRLIPILSAMYCISLIDRTNLSLARAANTYVMQKDLRLDVGYRYSICALIFFIPYIILEIPSQVGLRKFGARWWLGTSVILWGLVMVGMGFSNSWNTLAALRAVLGVFEATLFPGAAFLISCWYPRRQMAVRNTSFYVLSVVISGLSSILAWGISQLHGRNGLHGWQWIFIVQGILTVFIGLMGYVFIVDFPDKAHFLSTEQRAIVKTRIQRDRGDAEPDPMTWPKVRRYLCEPRLWLYGYMFGSTTVGSYSLAYFLPRILSQMGFTNAQSQLLVAPPYAWAAIPAISTAILSDRVRGCRSIAIAINVIFLIVGTVMYSQLDPKQKAARYAGIFFAIGGCNSNVPLVISWAQTSIRSQSKRGFTAALVVAWGGIGGIISSVAFMEREAPAYPTGVYLTIAMNVGVLLCCLGLNVYYRRQNRRADQGLVVLEGSEVFRYQM